MHHLIKGIYEVIIPFVVFMHKKQEPQVAMSMTVDARCKETTL